MASELINLDELEALLAAGTPGRAHYDHGPGGGGYRYRVMVDDVVIGGVHRESSAALFIALCNAAPAMIAELRRLRKVEEATGRMRDDVWRVCVANKPAMDWKSHLAWTRAKLREAFIAFDAAKKGDE